MSTNPTSAKLDSAHSDARTGARSGAHLDAPSAELARAESLILEIPDYPSEGILFRDITPLLADGPALRATVDALIAPFAGRFDVVAGLEARGFLLASAAAYTSGTGLMPIRKSGRLPRPAGTVGYALEYGTAEIEAHADFAPGSRVLLIDDVLATGGTLVAAHALMRELGYAVAGTAVLFEIDGLGGRAAIDDPALHTVFHS
ncbi:adenine phosphoribosyltransferase [Leucobacter rhizosphaerae]|uniref:Adenine phosphoribosyltransferase n=1 Tax=Leucobacter rhizosphaerae TaxID=2932245 RepID=A0ABY4FU26_9MICO|nr:adenine phosphoribosyltransferase [Leucobacter rhizosphaerae]UOQ59785.1 adenine phosphoribosyltransferase [Leucobacter rhizosphaerae]